MSKNTIHNRKPQEIVLFDNTNYSERYEQIRDELYERFAEEYDWEYTEDVPMDMVHDEMNFHEEIDYHYFKDKMKQLLKKNDCLLVGVCGRWNGPAEGGKFISNFYDLMSAIGHLDYYKVTDYNGHLIIEGYHHDGHDRYEVKQLTNKGYALARSYGFETDRRLHKTIMNCNIFSRLPRLATL